MELTKEIIFTSNEYCETPTHVRLSLDSKDYNRIALAMKLVREYDLFSVNIDASGELLEEGETLHESDFRAGVEVFTCYKNSFYYRAENKYDASLAIESEAMTLNELEQKVSRIEVELHLIEIMKTIGIDRPNNFNKILDSVYNDVCDTADPVEWHSGDVAIAFRRWIESKEE